MERLEKSIEVRCPLRTVYNQWTQFETWPRFMEDIQEVRQLDDTHLHWHTRINGRDEVWNAEITEQVPDERISWRSTSGAPNAGTVRFEPIDAERTRVRLAMSYEPQGFAETIGDALGVVSRHVEKSVKNFKEFIEQRGGETGAWRGEVRDGEKTRSTREDSGASEEITRGMSEAGQDREYSRTTSAPGRSSDKEVAEGMSEAGREREYRREPPESGRGHSSDKEVAEGMSEAGREREYGREPDERRRERMTPRDRPSRLAPFGAFDEPFAIMRRMMDDLDRAFAGLGWPARGARQGSQEPTVWSPRVEISQRGEELVVTADLPGVRKEDVSVDVDQDRLILQGERRCERESREGGVFRSECEYGSFYRVVPLPDKADPASAKASMEEGVLTVTLRAPQSQRGRRLKIETA